ncbi:rab GTPase-activating protein 1 [Parasteatoda tepidariorum]|nr:rab GTPase-activating protein 1 [Parasteatoda tepidariorum]XP_015930066.1 rab GTPase-activating protein 1 [Parasteatoda tepidariorum]
MAEDAEQSSSSLSTSEEFEIVGGGDVGITKENKQDKPHFEDLNKNEGNSVSLLNVTSVTQSKDLKPNNKLNRSDKQFKGEPVMDHPLALLSPQVPDSNASNQGAPDTPITPESAATNGNIGITPSLSSLEEISLSQSSSLHFADTDCSLFPHITYLGCAVINAPRSEKEIQRNMAILNEQALDQAIEITLSVPSHSEGSVTLLDSDGNTEIASFLIHCILFCARGRPETPEKECFAFACSHGETAETSIFHCHIFKCDSPDTVVKLLQCFAAAFHRVPKFSQGRASSISSERNIPIGLSVKNNQQVFIFETILDVKEEDSKGNFVSCPRDKDFFKLRCNLEKMITVTISQISSNKDLKIQNCFGLLITPGRNLDHSEMHALEGVLMNKIANGDRTVYHISANWNPIDPLFEILNTPTTRDNQVYMSVAVDLVFTGIDEPTRFVIETKAKIFGSNERFWYFSKRALHDQFYLRLKEIENDCGDRNTMYEVVSLENSVRKKFPSSLSYQESVHSLTSHDQDSESDNDEPLPSGTGEVSKECSSFELEGWAEVLQRWRQNLKQRPKQLTPLVKRGIPEALRGEVWQLLAGCIDDRQIVDTYKNLISKESSCGSVIQRDINRTFPAHEYFKTSGGIGQDSLYKICKAYSVYDPEIGYCQGQSFLAAALLLHIPEEQAFSILVKIMFEYGLRNFFKNGFEELHLRLYQLEKLIEDNIPELYAHFTDLGIEMHMFASQWFLTLYTSKFPLIVVFYILDIFLLDGIETLFQVALALLTLSRKDLLALDFEGILKYFRVTLPKKYRTENSARELLSAAISIKVKKLKKYAKDYSALKDQQKNHEDPVSKLQRENSRFQLSNLRLEHENDDLANELINVKSQLGNELKSALEKLEAYYRETTSTKKSLTEIEDEKRRLEIEVNQLKELCRRELQQAESEIARNNNIISEYKLICSQLNSRLEKEQKLFHDFMNAVKDGVDDCESCHKKLFSSNNTLIISNQNVTNGSNMDVVDNDKQVRELELELAQTKLALVEAECKNQDLIHQLNNAVAEIQASKNTWLHKTWSSLRDVTKKENSTLADNKDAT